MHSILGQVSFCTNYCIGEAISLWHCWGVMEAQVALIAALSSSVLLGLVDLIFLLKIPPRFAGQLAGQSSTVIQWAENQLPVVLALWAGDSGRWHPKSSMTGNFTLNLDSVPLHSSSRLWDPDFPMKCYISTVQFFFPFAQVRRFWRCLWFRSGFILGMRHL